MTIEDKGGLDKVHPTGPRDLVQTGLSGVASLRSNRTHFQDKERALSTYGSGYTPEQGERLRKIHERLIEARRELDALIGDAYLRPRANIVPVHFLDLASAAEKLRWAEKEWRELDKELAEEKRAEETQATADDEEPAEEPERSEREPEGALRH